MKTEDKKYIDKEKKKVYSVVGKCTRRLAADMGRELC